MIVLAFISACQKEVKLELDSNRINTTDGTVVENISMALTEEQQEELFSSIKFIHPETRSSYYQNSGIEEVLPYEGLVVIMFGASWDGPSKMYLTIFMNYALSCPYSDVRFAYYDIDSGEKLAISLGVQDIPTTIFIKNGDIKHNIIGILKPDKLNEKVEQYR